MYFVYRIVYAAHARGAHHKIALRAIAAMQGPDADKWRRMLLSHHDALLAGSKAPDTAFKDFQNHVLHVGDGDWGGAREAARRWYDRAVASLRRADWRGATYALGVLSHYVSDPMMPFHTASSEAEIKIHRAAEWSIAKTLERLFDAASAPRPGSGAPPPRSGSAHDFGHPQWLEQMVRDGAVAAHAQYQSLIDHYDLDRGAKNPSSGFDEIGSAAIAPLLARCVDDLAGIFERAFAEASAPAPEVMLNVATVIAALQVPVKWISNRLEDVADRAELDRIYAEIKGVGRLVEALPYEQRVLRERLAARAQAAASVKRRPPVAVSTAERAGHGRLRVEDPVEKAPSIGPKTAARLARVGVRMVGDLLAIDSAWLADALDDRRFTTSLLSRWRAQAELLTLSADLKPAHAVMLVVAGYRTSSQIQRADPAHLSAELARVAATPEISRAVWSAEAPNAAEAQRLIDSFSPDLHAAA